MKKLIIPLIVALFLTACSSPQGQQAYKTRLQTNLAAEHKVPVGDVSISFLQSCVFDVDSVDTIFYVQIKDSKTIYQYQARHCEEGDLSDFVKSVYSEDGKLPESFEK